MTKTPDPARLRDHRPEARWVALGFGVFRAWPPGHVAELSRFASNRGPSAFSVMSARRFTRQEVDMATVCAPALDTPMICAEP